MKVELKPDFPVSDEACTAETGKPLSHWIGVLEARPELKGKRREATMQLLYPEMNTGSAWWPTTAWVEYERKNGIVQKDGRAQGYNICVVKTINAPLEKVYAAWTSLELAKWFGDSPKLDADMSFTDQAGNRATALRVRENKDLRYRWTPQEGSETQVDVTFTDKGKGKTEVLVNHDRLQTRDEADGFRRAWGEALARLKTLLEG